MFKATNAQGAASTPAASTAMIAARRRAPRRRFLRLTAIMVPALFFALMPGGARAQGGPSHQPLRIVVGFAAGGPTDILARVVGAKMGEILGQQVIVENRVGASGNLASEMVAHAPPDGNTLLMTPIVFAVNESLFPNRRFEYKDFTAVAPLAETSNVLVVHPSLTSVPCRT